MTDLQKQAAEVVGRLTKAQELDLTSNWDAFCDADYGDMRTTDQNYPDALEAAGLAFLDDVDEDDLEQPFAWELGIEENGSVWRLTPLGLACRQFLQDNPHARDNEEMSDG